MITLVLNEALARMFEELATLDVESGGVLLVREFEHNGSIRLLAHEYIPVPDDQYDRREAYGLQIRSGGYVPALQRAEAIGCLPIWVHTHPGHDSSPRPSRHDDLVDSQLADLFRLRSDSRYYGAAIFAHSDGGLTFTGLLEDEQQRAPIDRLLVVGDRISLRVAADAAHEADNSADMFDRSIRAFGGAVQTALGRLRVAVVGCGGTGSAVAEQLVRLGVRHLTLIDPDQLTLSNVTRVYGSATRDVGRPKVDVLGDHLEAIARDVECVRHQSMLTVETTARTAAAADIVFGCTDDNAGRLVLSRLATYMMTLVIDCGVLLTSNERGQLDGVHGRVTVLSPGNACLVCRGRIDTQRAASELLTPAERQRRVDEGYAPALGGVEPAVVTFTTAVAAAAVSELIERLTGFGPSPVPSEVLLRLHDREISTNVQGPRPRHYCHPGSGKLGAGPSEPFLEQTWGA